MKKVFEKALNDYKFIKHLLENYSGDYDSLISNANGRKIDNERYDIDVNTVTITLVRTEGNKVAISGKIDVYCADVYCGAYTYDEIVNNVNIN